MSSFWGKFQSASLPRAGRQKSAADRDRVFGCISLKAHSLPVCRTNRQTTADRKIVPVCQSATPVRVAAAGTRKHNPEKEGSKTECDSSNGNNESGEQSPG